MSDSVVIICLLILLVVMIGLCIFLYGQMKKLQESLVSLIQNQQNTLNDTLLKNTTQIDQSVVHLYQALNDSNQQTHIQLNNLTKISSSLATSNQSIESLKKSIQDFSNILNDKKLRGIFGEAQLSRLYENVFGQEGNYYKLQYKLTNNCIVDSVLFLNKKLLCVDAKFPLDNYQRLVELNENDSQYTAVERLFIQDIKVKINDISSKYIIENETLDYALMFIPAVSIYDTIVDHYPSLLNYAHARHVVLVSPVTLMVTIEVLSTLNQQYYQVENMNAIVDQLQTINKTVEMLITRSGQVEKDLAKVTQDYHQLAVSLTKVTNQIQNLTSLKK